MFRNWIKKIWNQLNENNGAVIAILSFFLVSSTFYYAIQTRKTVNIMQDQFDLSYKQFQQNNRPYLFIEKFKWTIHQENNKDVYKAIVKNSGNIPAKFKSEKAYFVIDNKEYLAPIEEKKYLLVFPHSEGREIVLSIDDEEERKQIRDSVMEQGNFKVISKFNYWAIWDEKLDNPFFYEEHREMTRDPKDYSNFNYELSYINAN